MQWLPISARKFAQGARTLGERLGYGAEERLLIVHADDLGIAPAVNAAFISGFATGLINSGSIIVPGRSLAEIAGFARAHPEVDLGLHLTLTSDSVNEPWSPVASPSQVPSLVNEQGNFLGQWDSHTRVNPSEVEIELRAQIEKAYAFGIRPSHIDSHRFRLHLSGDLILDVYLRLAREYGLTALIPRQWFSRVPYLKPALTEREVTLDRMVIINGNVTPKQWPDFYRGALESLPPGISEFLIHPGYDNEELQRFFDYRDAWGAAWRQRDFDFFTGQMFRDLLSQHDIKLITWRDIAKRLAARSVFARIRDMFGSA